MATAVHDAMRLRCSHGRTVGAAGASRTAAEAGAAPRTGPGALCSSRTRRRVPGRRRRCAGGGGRRARACSRVLRVCLPIRSALCSTHPDPDPPRSSARGLPLAGAATSTALQAAYCGRTAFTMAGQRSRSMAFRLVPEKLGTVACVSFPGERTCARAHNGKQQKTAKVQT